MRNRTKITGAFITAAVVMLSGCAAGGSGESSAAQVTRNDLFGTATSGTDSAADTTAADSESSSETSAPALQPFANGRESGKTTTVGAGEYVSNEFFRFKLNDAEVRYNVNDYCPNDVNNTHLRVNITLNNEYTEAIPIGVYDFTIVYTENGEEVEYDPLNEDFTAGQFPLDETLAKNGTAEGDLYFIVPYGINDFKLKYVEYYDDDFIGNTNIVEFSVPNEDEQQRAAAIEEDLAAQSAAEETDEAGSDASLRDTYVKQIGDTVQTKYISFNVSGVKRMSELDGVEGYEGYDYVEVSMKVKNTYDNAISIYDNDFVVTYDLDGEPYYAANITDVSTICETKELAAGETLNVVDYYWVPAECTEFTLNYIDLVSDEVYDMYDVEFSATSAV